MERDGQHARPRDHAAAPWSLTSHAGLTTFDMADHYGSAEDDRRDLCSRRRQSGESRSPPSGSRTRVRSRREDVRAAVERALDRLRTRSIDLLQFHAWNYADPSYLETSSISRS